ncbi:hypothetical protein LAZ67_16002074 [Cordylochernes scorpioides]|uniref:Uncharacterized protein n=1 Tax=Cordylochernes scorpioides TaxID=51811 RepID=A0ABY6LGG9_9ARAC|nr:hypothetical protein LAZ67_16002074 [Cordylochernes scorpioides]
MPLNSSRPRATPRLSKVHECQTTRQKQATFRARSAAGQADQCVYLEFCPDFTQEQYFRALEAKLGKGTIYQLTKMEGHILAGLSSVPLSDKLIEEGLDIEDATLRAFPKRKRAERIVLGNVLFFVEDTDLVAPLRPYGQATSIIQKMMQFEDSFWANARREVFITLRERVKIFHIPARLDVKSKGVVTHFYVTYGIKCSLCHKQEHKQRVRQPQPGPSRQTEATLDSTAPRQPLRPMNIIEQIKVSRQMLDQCRSKAAAGTFDQMVYLEYSPEFTPVDYIKALENKLGKSYVVQLGKASGKVLVGLERPEMAEKIIEDGLMIRGTLLKALPYQKKAEKITISGLPYVIEDADIIRTLRPYCQVVSIAPALNSSGGYTWLDLKKTAFILTNN